MFPPPLKHLRNGESLLSGMTFSGTPPGLHQPEVRVGLRSTSSTQGGSRGWITQRSTREEVGGVGVTRRASPGSPKRLKLSGPWWLQPGIPAFGWLREGDSWKSEANLGYTV